VTVPTGGSEIIGERGSLAALVGEWREQATFADALPTDIGRTVFEWVLGGRFLLQRSESPQSDVPSSVAIIAPDKTPETFTQHYFDSRGVVRLYAMTIRNGIWMLERTTPDFTPLDFSQRFIGTFSNDGNAIEGAWQTSHDAGATWEHDFGLTYTRIRQGATPLPT
jgi:hypothetical protein